MRRDQDERIERRSLEECVAAARRSLFDQDPGPDDPIDFATLLAGLDHLGSFPGIYRAVAIEPLRAALERLGADGLTLMQTRQQGHLLVFDLVQALSQRHGSYHRHELMAFQEVVNDLFDGFLSAEDRRGLKPADEPIPAPLVKWGRPEMGPYCFGIDQMAALGVRCGVVSLPGAVARADGLFSWGALPHETSGHGILACERGLLAQLASKVASALRHDLVKPVGTLDLADRHHRSMLEVIIDHWVYTLEEAASDVLGVLNMGPAAAIAGLIMLRASIDVDGAPHDRLRSADLLDRHPVPALRPVLAAGVLLVSGFGAIAATSGWSERIASLLIAEARGLVENKHLVIAGQDIDIEIAITSAKIVASVVASARTIALGKASLRAIQTWRDRDEQIVGWLRLAFSGEASPKVEELLGAEFYAAHVVAAAILEALAQPSKIPQLHRDMVSLLAVMHDANPTWGPLSVLFASDLSPRRTATGGIPRRLGTGSGGFPRRFEKVVARRAGNVPRRFWEEMLAHQAGEIGQGARRSAGEAESPIISREEIRFPFPISKASRKSA